MKNSGSFIKKIIAMLMCCVLLVSVTGCSDNSGNNNNTQTGDDSMFEIEGNQGSITGYTVQDEKNPLVAMKTNYGTIVVELYPDVAPNTVNNFISLVKSGFYDGLTFHRVIEGFMIQGGDPLGTGAGGPGYCIKGEFLYNGFKNSLKHTRGVISMARRSSPLDSAGSQFFIMHKDYPSLNGMYASFGMTVSGIEVVDVIATVATNSSDKPVKDVIIEKMIVDTKGVEYPEPEKVSEV